jgi:NADH:ubiquinone oxidoreductase subunit F (NADH-binding)
LPHAIDILNRLCDGKGKPEDLASFETLTQQFKTEDTCVYGKAASNTLQSILKYFRSELEAHIRGECPAGRCSALIEYRIGEDCKGCSICALNCPALAIQSVPYCRHFIDTLACTKCDVCRQSCPKNAVAVVPGA